MKYWIIIFVLFIGGVSINAQELNCTVQVNSDQIQGSNKSIFTTLQSSIAEFMNNRRWTEMSYGNLERIDCTLNILVKEYTEATNVFGVTMTVQSRRPVYASGYNTTLLNFQDTEITFEYKEFDPLEFRDNSFESNLTAVLAYYAYIIIGYDLDSYSRLGGTPLFQAAEDIVRSAQSSDYMGWKAELANSRNRYALANNLMDEAFKKYRNYFYEYHRLGLDEMSTNAVNARARIEEGLPILREANRARPSAIVITSFLDAKLDEIINIFSESSKENRQKVHDIIMDIAPTRSNQLERLLK